MISHDHQCIFVHIPKTGGTSVENAIWGPDWSTRTPEQLWMGAVRPGFNKYQSGGLQHLLARQIREEVGEATFERFYTFAFVRNPWSKAVSQYRYIKTRKDLLRFMGMSRWTSFDRYLDLIQQTEHVQSMPQWQFVLDEDGTCLVDFVGRFEQLDRDFRVVADRLGISDALPHAMQSKGRKPYRAFYTRRSIDKVAAIYSRDIEHFGYSFDD